MSLVLSKVILFCIGCCCCYFVVAENSIKFGILLACSPLRFVQAEWASKRFDNFEWNVFHILEKDTRPTRPLTLARFSSQRIMSTMNYSKIENDNAMEWTAFLAAPRLIRPHGFTALIFISIPITAHNSFLPSISIWKRDWM